MYIRKQHSQQIKNKRRNAQHDLGRSYIEEDKKRGCEICGYNKFIGALDYHHVRGEKRFELSSNSSRSIKTIQEEIDKCMLVCANCHRELHAENNGVYNNEEAIPHDDLNKQINISFYL